MQLESISISLNEYGQKAGTYDGRIKYRGEYGTTEIYLDAKLSEEVLKLCAESLVRATKELAQNLTAAVFESAGIAALEDRS